MSPRIRNKLSYSNVTASLALFIALSGVAVAAGLPRNSVGPNQLKRGAVTPVKLRKEAVTSPKLAPGSVIPGKLSANAVGPGNIANGAVTSAKLGVGAVIAASIRNGVVTTNKLQNGAVTGGKLGANAVGANNIANGSVTQAKLSSDAGPLLGTLRSGQTLRGTFAIGGPAGQKAYAAQSFQFPLLNAPTASVVDPATSTTTACPGITGGNGQTPQAAAGQLCIYVTSKSDLETLSAETPGLNRLGFALEATGQPGEPFFAYGQWAVTAP